MLDSRYTDIRDAVEATDDNFDSDLFHQTINRLASILGFKKKAEWYEAKALGPPAVGISGWYAINNPEEQPEAAHHFPDVVWNFDDFSALDACIRSGMLFRYFEHNNHYEKNSDSFTASTLYENHMGLVTKTFAHCTVTSPSTLGLKYNVLSHSEFSIMYPGNDSKPDVMRALDKKCLIKVDDQYIMSPKYLLRLAEQKGFFR